MTRAGLTIPADFATVGTVMTIKQCAAHYGVAYETVRSWRRKFNAPDFRRRDEQAPDDLAEMYEALGSQTKLARHYGTRTTTVATWLRDKGINRPSSRLVPVNRRPMPEGFAEVAPTMTRFGLAKHYQTNDKAIQRWLDEAQVGALSYTPRAPAYNRPQLRYVRSPSHSNIAPTRTYSAEDQAADVLRKWAAVYRCKPNGRADHTGTHWRMGNTVLTGPELIQRAERKAPRVA